MKKVKVTINLLMEVPDDWEVVEHVDGIPVFDMGDGRFMDITFAPMVTSDAGEGAEWSDDFDDDFANSILDMVTECDTEMEAITVQ